MRTSLQLMTVAFAGAAYAVIEMGQPKSRESSQKADTSGVNTPRSFSDLIHILETEFGYNVRIFIKTPPKDIETKDTELGIGIVSKNAAEHVWNTMGSLWNKPESTIGDLSWKAEQAADYVANYQLSEDDMKNIDPDEFDCNDYARRACQRLERHGLPMYFVNIWPNDPELRLEESSHQVAVCKLKDSYLICDNDDIIFWRGSLAEFAQQYNAGNPKAPEMSLMSTIGISKYKDPKHDNAISKFMLQYAYSVSEEEMRPTNIDIDPPPTHIADIL